MYYVYELFCKCMILQCKFGKLDGRYIKHKLSEWSSTQIISNMKRFASNHDRAVVCGYKTQLLCRACDFGTVWVDFRPDRFHSFVCRVLNYLWCTINGVSNYVECEKESPQMYVNYYINGLPGLQLIPCGMLIEIG